MKVKNLACVAALASFGVLAGCSDTSTPSSAASDLEGTVNVADGAVVSNTSYKAAKVKLARYSHSVVNQWEMDTTAANQETVSGSVDSAFQEGGNFAIEADVAVNSSNAYTIASAGVGGAGTAWLLQVENGEVVFKWRENEGGDWKVLKADNLFRLGEWNDVRLEHVDSLSVLIVNGEIAGAFKHSVNLDVQGDFTIGFDRTEGDRGNDGGRIAVIRIEHSFDIYVIPAESSSSSVTPEDTNAINPIDPIDPTENDSRWIADWEFNDSASVGLDVTGNGHDAVIGEGAVTAVDGIANFDGKSGFSVKLAEDININDFVVEARVKPTQFGTMQNIIVAEPPGRGVDGWQLRIDEGVLRVHLRDTDKDFDDWHIFPGKKMALNEWSEIRLERSADSVKLFQDGELTVAAAYTGDLTQMRYDWSIGFDGMQQAFHNRYFIGEMDYVRFGKLEGFSAGEVVNVVEKPLVAWEFNEPTFVGLDAMANNSTKTLVGYPTIADTTVTLDGKSGLQVKLSPVFKRNTFAVETRVKPVAFGEMQNIIVAEPPGRYGDGWIIRVDDGVLTAHFRDEDVDGTDWNVLVGEKLALNEWTDIRVERTADSVKVFQNGKLTASAAAKGDVSQLGYNIGIAYDAMMQAKHNRFFNGEIDYIRYYGL